jgi:hypothetical protein
MAASRHWPSLIKRFPCLFEILIIRIIETLDHEALDSHWLFHHLQLLAWPKALLVGHPDHQVINHQLSLL